MAPVMAVALDVMDRPWEWGEADCCTSVCDVFFRLYGIDPMACLRGKYSTKLGAIRKINSYGGFIPMSKVLADQHDLHECEPKVGAIGAIDSSLLICVKPDLWLGKTLHGLSPVSSASVAYHVEV